MQDTTRQAQAKQLEIILSKTTRERAIMGIYMMESVCNIIRNSIKLQHPEFTKQEITAAVFMRYYGHEFSKEEAQKIVAHLKSV